MEKFGRVCKETMIREMAVNFDRSPSFITANFVKIKVSEIEKLKRELSKSSSKYVTMKNSIAKLVLREAKLEQATSLIEGPIAVALVGDDPIAASRTLVNFSKEHEGFKIRGGFIDGQLFEVSKIKEFAALPTRDVLIAKVVGGIKSPITGFVNVLGGTIRGLVYALSQIKTKKEDGTNG